MLPVALHLIFWAPFILRGRLDRATGREQTGSAVHAARFPGGLVWLHSLGVAVMYWGMVQGLLGGPKLGAGSALAGLLVGAGGVAIAMWSLLVFRSWRLRAELAAGHELCVDGPFAWVRHPIYAAMLLLAVATCLLVPTALGLAAVPVMAVTGDIRARAEERVLRAMFGERYTAYAARTRRFIPGIY